MSTEEKTTENPETVEPPKLKRRFKLDKKHIQGFIAGILLCGIAFTGLYYGTDKRFFKGEMLDNYIGVTNATFEEAVIKSEIPVLVIFWSEWSGPSKELRLMAREIGDFYTDSVKFAYVNVDDTPFSSAQYGVREVPTCSIFKNGKIVDRKVGILTTRQLIDWIEVCRL